MTERLSSNSETHHETPAQAEQLLLPTAEQAETLRAGEADPSLQAAIAREEIARTADKQTETPLDRLKAAEAAEQPAQPLNINRELKAITLNRELRNIQRKLPAVPRGFSKLVHQPVIRAISEVTDKTISRPSGLLGGSLVAFLGTAGYFYLAKSMGFNYNYLVFLVLFAGGFIIGLGLELLVYLATSSRRHSND